MTEATTLNIDKPDAARFIQLQLNHSAKEGRRVSQPEYLAHVAGVMEHLQNCATCNENIHHHIKVRKTKEGKG